MIDLCQRFRDLCDQPSQDEATYRDFLYQAQTGSLETQSCLLDVMLDHALPCPTFPEAIDVCGTGGSGLHKRNISTAVAFVLAGMGVSVSKHGNRSATSLSGSADVWTCLGLPLRDNLWDLQGDYDRHHLAFVFAPVAHPALKALASARKAIGVPTLFNRLGPLANPTRPKYQLLGVSRSEWLMDTAHLLHQRGVHRAWVVCGRDGGDDISLYQPTDCVDVGPHGCIPFTLDPATFPFPPSDPTSLHGGTPEENATALVSILQQQEGHAAYRYSVILNAAAALVIVGRAKTLFEGIELAQQCLIASHAYRLYQLMVDGR